MEQEIDAPAPKKNTLPVPHMNKTAASLILFLIILGVGFGFYYIGTTTKKSEDALASPATEATSPAAAETANPTSSVKPTQSPSPTPTVSTPTSSPTPTIQTKVINSTASLDGWRASNGGGNITWYIQTGRNATLTSRGYVSFDLSSIPSGATITETSLRLYQKEVVGTPYSGNSIVVDHVDYGSSLGSEDYALTPLASAIGTLSANPSIEWKDLGVTSYVKNDISSSRTRSQFRIRFLTEATGSDAWARFESGDNYMATGNLPQLVVKYY